MSSSLRKNTKPKTILCTISPSRRRLSSSITSSTIPNVTYFCIYKSEKLLLTTTMLKETPQVLPESQYKASSTATSRATFIQWKRKLSQLMHKVDDLTVAYGMNRMFAIRVIFFFCFTQNG